MKYTQEELEQWSKDTGQSVRFVDEAELEPFSLARWRTESGEWDGRFATGQIVEGFVGGDFDSWCICVTAADTGKVMVERVSARLRRFVKSRASTSFKVYPFLGQARAEVSIYMTAPWSDGGDWRVEVSWPSIGSVEVSEAQHFADALVNATRIAGWVRAEMAILEAGGSDGTDA